MASRNFAPCGCVLRREVTGPGAACKSHSSENTEAGAVIDSRDSYRQSQLSVHHTETRQSQCLPWHVSHRTKSFASNNGRLAWIILAGAIDSYTPQ